MRMFQRLFASMMPLTFLLLPSVAPAAPRPETHVVDAAQLQDAIGVKLDQASADRQAIRRLLARPQVAEIAAGAGLSLGRAQSAVDVLSGPELASLAAQARQADEQLAGGRPIVITTTAIIIALLVVIIILVA
jgi:hypothetical protein